MAEMELSTAIFQHSFSNKSATTLGLVPESSSLEYRQNPGISRSEILDILKSEIKFCVGKYEHGETDTDAFRIGRLIHSLVLEPYKVQDEYLVIDKRNKESKKLFDELTISGEISKYTVVTPGEWESSVAIASSLRNSDFMKDVLQSGAPEQSFYWRDAQTGLLCKCRPDWYDPINNICIDVKSTTDASPHGFQRDFAAYGYYIQSVYYRNGIEAVTGVRPRFIFAAVEKKSPYCCGFYEVSETGGEDEEAQTAFAQSKIDTALQKIQELFNRDFNAEPIISRSYTDGIEEIKLPAWAYYE